jgi:hypothetical protein
VITAGDEFGLHLVEPRVKLPSKQKVTFAQSIRRILRLRTAKFVVSNKLSSTNGILKAKPKGQRLEFLY